MKVKREVENKLPVKKKEDQPKKEHHEEKKTPSKETKTAISKAFNDFTSDEKPKNHLDSKNYLKNKSSDNFYDTYGADAN